MIVLVPIIQHGFVISLSDRCMEDVTTFVRDEKQSDHIEAHVKEKVHQFQAVKNLARTLFVRLDQSYLKG